jgi:transcription initiation factor TFIID subunit 10
MTDPSSSQLGSSDLPQPLPASQRTLAQDPPLSSATIADHTASSSTVAAPDGDTDLVGGDDIDVSMDQGTNMTAGDTANINMPGQNGGTNTGAPVNSNESFVPGIISNPVAPPSKKESTLREFLGKMDEYAPIVCR